LAAALPMRIDVGKGYRVNFIQRGSCVIVLLAGGDKCTQKKDIEKARELAKEVYDESTENETMGCQ